MRLESPEYGWEEQTYYRVQVSNFEGNPYHDSILYIGFLQNDGSPGGYSGLMSTCEDYHWRDLSRLGRNCIIRKPIKLFTSKSYY